MQKKTKLLASELLNTLNHICLQIIFSIDELAATRRQEQLRLCGLFTQAKMNLTTIVQINGEIFNIMHFFQNRGDLLFTNILSKSRKLLMNLRLLQKPDFIYLTYKVHEFMQISYQIRLKFDQLPIQYLTINCIIYFLFILSPLMYSLDICMLLFLY